MKLPDNNKLENETFEWFKQKGSEGIPVSLEILSVQACEINNKLGVDTTFKASSGWLRNFKARPGIRQISIQGEQRRADTSLVSQFVEDLHHEILCRQLSNLRYTIVMKRGLIEKHFPTNL
ncbi:hypothetical protein ANN_17394 [Periplaneta americana]|uniref:HTH CENPB-type domain-containing protein n=1 Tax=Periplaneta americana TaxID=6978 RepID=A0ABQ8SSU4_PERAM|nr:hypothetical protein ANN_17394 [Periplaneta americana]